MSDRLKALGLLALALLLYGFDLGRGLYFDDPVYISENALLRRDDALRAFWFSTEAFNYYPVFWSLLRAQWLLWGDAPAGWHAVNLLVHGVNAVLVWRIALAWRLAGAWWIAALFAVHPLQVQTLAWAAEQKNTWSFLFMALAILAFITHARRGDWRSYAAALLCFAAALGCKTSVVALPLFLALCYRAKAARLVPFFALGLAAGLATLWFERHRVVAHSLVDGLELWQRSEAAAAALWFYAGKALLPVGLTPFYPGWVDATAAAHTAGPLGALLAVAAGCALLWRRIGAPIALGLAYYALLLSPLLGIFDGSFFVFSRIADHWQYHALPGLLAATVAAAHAAARRWPPALRFAPAAGVASVLGLAALASAHLAHFEDARSLWTHAVARNPDAWIAWYNLGCLHSEAGAHPEAIAAFRETLRARPANYRAAFNLANALGAAGRREEAERAWLAARAIVPDDPDAAVNHAVVLLHLDREEEALAGFRHALALEPGKTSAVANLEIIRRRRADR